MTAGQERELLALAARVNAVVWTDQPDRPRVVPNRADRRRNRKETRR